MKEVAIRKLYYAIDKIKINGTKTLDDIYQELFDTLTELGIEKENTSDNGCSGFNPTWSMACDMLQKNIWTECIMYAIRGDKKIKELK